MSSLSLRLPDSLHRKVRELAEREDISINQFIATAVAEKAAALLAVEYLAERGRRADPKLLGRLLSRVPDVHQFLAMSGRRGATCVARRPSLRGRLAGERPSRPSLPSSRVPQGPPRRRVSRGLPGKTAEVSRA